MNDEAQRVPSLPPRPDPVTGEPFPPHGRGFRGDERAAELQRGRETRSSHKPDPPPGRGPVLAWYKKSKLGKLAVFSGAVTIIAVGSSILMLFRGEQPLFWMQFWQVWLIVLAGSLLATAPLTSTVLSVGADWFQYEVIRFGRRRKYGVIDLYDLKWIKADPGGATFYLDLIDQHAGVHLALHEWQHDQRMWDLVYNGILHSVAAGADVNANARALLELDQMPELRNPHGNREIDVTKLTEDQVRALMSDAGVQFVLNAIAFDGGPSEFRKLYARLPEELLAGRVDPEWFPQIAHRDDHSDTSAKWGEDDRWTRFYRGRD